ncbi:hypothetical protein N752_28805 [Desulforamulus aquiferis]|nr:hypothetical protein [Desulforamulus aquiferis]RYD01578.1 hypothetical protein N752_28805 [Desulforamulus aquiferis]
MTNPIWAKQDELPKITAPTNLRAEVDLDASQIKLTWKDNSKNETGFIIERKTLDSSYSEIAKVKEDATSYIDSEPYNNTKHFYRVRLIIPKLIRPSPTR